MYLPCWYIHFYVPGRQVHTFLKASRVGFSQAQRFLTGAVILRAHGLTPAPAPQPQPPPILYFWLSGLSPEWEHCFQGNFELLGALLSALSCVLELQIESYRAGARVRARIVLVLERERHIARIEG